MSRRQQQSKLPIPSSEFIRKYKQWVVNPNGSNFRTDYCDNGSWCPNFKKKHPIYEHLCFFYHPPQANQSENDSQQSENDGVSEQFLVKFAYWKHNPERSNFRQDPCRYGDNCLKFQIKHPKFDHMCAFKHSDQNKNEQPEEQTIQQVYIMTKDSKQNDALVNNQTSNLAQKEVKPQINGQKNNPPSKPMWQIMAENRKKQPGIKSEISQAKNPSIKSGTLIEEQQSQMQQKQVKLETKSQSGKNQHQKKFKQQLPVTTKPCQAQSFSKPKQYQSPSVKQKTEQLPKNESQNQILISGNQQKMSPKRLQQEPAYDTKQIIAKMCSLIPFLTQIKGEQVDEQISEQFYKISQSMSKIESIYNKLADQKNALIE